MNDLCSKGAVELAGMIATRKVTATEVIEAHLARIAEVNPRINAVTVTLADEALVAAAEVDSAVRKGEPIAPLAGVPFTIKENIDVARSATTWGTLAFAEQRASADAPCVQRLKEAGAIPLARTNLPDFAFRWDTVSGRAGRTLNPWDVTRAVGGSSGGDAAALATGMTPLGLGNDLGGSLRVPAQMCGIAALRPTRGRVAHVSVTQPWPEPLSIQMTNCQGPMARRVADLRVALDLMSAPDARDPRWIQHASPSALSPGRIKVAVVRDPGGLGIDPHVRAGLDRAADALADAGYQVVDVEPPHIQETARLWFDTIWADVGAMWPNIEPAACPEQNAMVRACLSQAVFSPIDQPSQQSAWMAVHQHATAWSLFLAEHPIILSPVCCERPWPIGDDISRISEIATAMRMVVAVNILGLPSCAVPVGSDQGLPQGVQLIGARFTESRLLDAAEAIERRSPVVMPRRLIPAMS
jgi:amidase